ncbi:S41 family peptidase [Bacillus sp. 31A1R]|uniref:S41 family peptidase n=1 Tax=Robertmurraya mangrovi TaxID=3098077 RepID=A0ABU5IYZ9_9BACI|nr:S41 family peptidase [Bacillus sp. 31A1R]MDZ5472356.1 S41 family peptidase [Bacillus sp. 31A1R]
MKHILIVLTLVIWSIFPVITNATNHDQPQESIVENNSTFSALEEIKQILKESYYKQVPEDVLNAKTIEELLSKLNDPYTDYMSSEEFDHFLEMLNQNYSGIGVALDISDEAVLITNVFKNGPADKMGLQNGDIVTKVDNHVLTDQPIEVIQSYFLGKENTVITVTVKRGKKELVFSGKRETIHIPLVESKLLDGNVGYIKITSFGEETYDEFLTHLNKLNKNKATKWIIDLRSNGGGLVLPALQMMDHFIRYKEDPVLKFVYGNGEEPILLEKTNLPLNKSIILTDEYTASASEILTYALKTNQAATIMGSKTFGKGVIQASDNLSDNSLLKYTVAEVKSMNNESYNNVGITPDIELNNLFPTIKSASDQWLSFARLYQQNKTGKATLNDIKVNIAPGKKITLSNYPLLTNDLKETIQSLMAQKKVEILTKSGWVVASPSKLSSIKVKMYELGDGLYVSESNSIKYETPSKKMLVKLKKENKVAWGKTYLKKGQIGRVTILSNTPLYKLNSSGKYILQSKSLNSGKQYPVYNLKKYSK